MNHGIERLVAYHCAPTLMGVKAGNLFSLKRNAYAAQADKMKDTLHTLGKKGLSAHIFHSPGDTTLVYLYRRELLEQNLSHPLSKKLLAKEGYAGEDAEELLCQLRLRLEKSEAFPHEIGLFLGYPPEDVMGFVRHKGFNCKFSGCWKVYGDVGRAKTLFGQYAFCRNQCLGCVNQGMTLDQMVAAS